MDNSLDLVIKNKKTMLDDLLTSDEQERFQKILESLDLFNDGLTDLLENPFNIEEQKRIEHILNENVNIAESDSYSIISSLQLNIDSNKLERIRRIDQLLEEMKTDGHAYIKNIASNKCKSKYIKTMTNKTLDELKAEMNKIDDSIANNRKNREAEEIKNQSIQKAATCHNGAEN